MKKTSTKRIAGIIAGVVAAIIAFRSEMDSIENEKKIEDLEKRMSDLENR